MTKKQKKMLLRIGIASVLLVALQLIGADRFSLLDGVLFSGAGRLLRLVCYLVNYLVIGHDILRKALLGIRNRRILDENFLMAVATLGALALAIYENGDYLEAVAVMLFYQIGELFQSYAVGKSRRNISALMDIRPDYAHVEENGAVTRVDPEEVAVGSIILVQPGEKIPIDGVVVAGASSLDTAALTGESLPRTVGEGDSVISGCISLTGVLKIRTTKEFSESTVSKILELVENASSRKSRSEAFISRFARVYTPAVCAAALALAVLPPLLSLLLGQPAAFGIWIYRALTLLVISCPCALVISIPLSFFAGIGGAGQAGILVKGSNYLESLAQVKTVVLDKTGTLTQGNFAVNEVCGRDRLLEYAAYAECASSHPIAQSLRRAYGKPINRSRVEDIQEFGGMGITARVDGIAVAVGNPKLMAQLGISLDDCPQSGTTVHVAADGCYMGHICISDALKPQSKAAVAALKKAGVQQLVMLTGDAEAAAQAAADQLGISRVCCQLMPADKVEKVEQLLQAQPKGKLAFVGDGINDAPVLSRADIGIAMGAMGSDAAIEAADVVLMDDDPLKIAKAIRIARKCMAIVRQNIVFALGVKFACLILGALGLANMYFAIFADVGVMILAVLNAIRCLFVKKV